MTIKLTDGFSIEPDRFLRLRHMCGGGIWNTFNRMEKDYKLKLKTICTQCEASPTKNVLFTYRLWSWNND